MAKNGRDILVWFGNTRLFKSMTVYGVNTNKSELKFPFKTGRGILVVYT